MKWFSIVLLFWMPSALSAQSFSNDDVLELHHKGLSSAVILAKIGTVETAFDTSTDALIALKEAGVPDDVIAAMVTGPTPPAAEITTASSLPTDGSLVVRQGASQAANVRTQFAGTPCTAPGIFVETGDGLVEVDPTTYSQAKSGGRFLSSVTYGIKSVKSRAVIRGAQASVRLRDPSPSFLFCFEESESGLSYETKGATNPTEFLLVEFEVKKGQREVVVGKINAWRGAQSGAPLKFVRDTRQTKLAPGVYRVTPNAPLASGEYGFYYAGSAPVAMYGMGGASSGNKVFTFGLG